MVSCHHVFFSGVTNQTHLVYGAAWIRELLEQTSGQVRVTLLPTKQFLAQDAISLTTAAQFLPASDRLDITSAATARHRLGADEVGYLLSVGSVGLRAWSQLRRANPLARLRVIITDEGLGSYGNAAARRQAWLREGRSNRFATMRSMVGAATKLLGPRNYFLHRETRSGWQLRDSIVEEFQRQQRRSSVSNQAVFLSQPWPELGVVSESNYLAHMTELAEACSDAGLDFLVHPHPAEPTERYSAWPTSPEPKMAEFDPSCVSAALVLGGPSTALLNLAAIHQVPALHCVVADQQSTSELLVAKQRRLLAHYLGEPVNQFEARAAIHGRMGR